MFLTVLSGQDGSYLTELLLEKNYKVYGLSRKKTVTNLENLRKNLNSKNFIFLKGDLLEESKLNEIIRKIQPDEIYNLAGDSFVPGSWVNPIFTCNVNALGVLKLLNAIRIYSPYSTFYQASSSEIFGNISKIPQDENTYHYPISPYGCAKSFGFNITRNYRESYGLFACNGILFNHESERRDIEHIARCGVPVQHRLDVVMDDLEHGLSLLSSACRTGDTMQKTFRFLRSVSQVGKQGG